ncbi:hypothetical protein ABZ092_37380 [Streptomyces bobili]|uniref:hypothetical protein n=1 Tax=Streptomyces bobili TaxID=67280 RepID=UPI0033B87850
MSYLRDRVTGLRRTGIRSFHEIERNLVGVNGPDALPHNETGVIGWGTSWRMQGYLLMAERTGRPAYCERLAELIDQVLQARDDVRGVSDFRGRSLPVWSSAHKFTAASAVLCDTDGRPALEVTVCPPHARTAKVTVAADGERQCSVTDRGGRAPRLRHDVGGKGRRGTDREQAYVAAWLPLRRWSREAPRLVRAVRPPAPPLPLMGVDTYCAALLAS